MTEGALTAREESAVSWRVTHARPPGDRPRSARGGHRHSMPKEPCQLHNFDRKSTYRRTLIAVLNISLELHNLENLSWYNAWYDERTMPRKFARFCRSVGPARNTRSLNTDHSRNPPPT
jgi:hypothetical protein